MKTVGEKLKKLRDNREVSTQTVANHVHLSREEVHAIEKGTLTPTFSAMIAFATYFDVSLDYLSGLDKPKNAPDNGISYNELNDITNATSELIETHSGKDFSLEDKMVLNDKINEFLERVDIPVYDEENL